MMDMVKTNVTRISAIDANVEEMLQLIEMLWRRVQLSTVEVLSGDWSNEDEKIAEKIQEIRDNHTHYIGTEEHILTPSSSK